MFKRILVVLENEVICLQALQYAREFAQRMDAEVALLMVVEMAFLDTTWLGSKRSAISEVDQRGAELLSNLSAEFLRDGIATSAALRVGDPGQELLKFLAERPPFQVVIWGSGEDIAGGRRGHWLAKAANSLECPLWTVSSRKKTKPVSSRDK
jgi:nucleotide-binding universal stress UspA family protein